MVSPHLTCAAVLAVCWPLAAQAALPGFVPGGAPCDGVCSHEWAMAQTGIEDGTPRPVTIYQGDTVLWMSYGAGGEPRGSWSPMRVATEGQLTGVGYPVRWRGRRVLFVKLDACDNWALIKRDSVMGRVWAREPLYLQAPVYADVSGGFGVFTSDRRHHHHHHHSRLPPEEPPAPVPVPATLPMFAAALGAMGFISRQRRNHRV